MEDPKRHLEPTSSANPFGSLPRLRGKMPALATPVGLLRSASLKSLVQVQAAQIGAAQIPTSPLPKPTHPLGNYPSVLFHLPPAVPHPPKSPPWPNLASTGAACLLPSAVYLGLSKSLNQPSASFAVTDVPYLGRCKQLKLAQCNYRIVLIFIFSYVGNLFLFLL